MSAKQNAIKEFYSSLGISKTNSKHLRDELLYNLYTRPKRDKGTEMPHFQVGVKNAIHQADLLFLPDDDGYRYALVVCDIASNTTDAEPLKTKNSKEVLKAIQTIYSRKYLNLPSFQIIVDSGSEFKGTFTDYFREHKIIVKTADVNRHRQVAVVEAKNKIIGKALLMRQTAQELNTGEPSREWVEFLPIVIQKLNKKLSHKPKPVKMNQSPIINNPIIPEDTKVRVALDTPKDVAYGKRLHGKFRSSDIRFDTKIRKVDSLLFYPGQPILYSVTEKPHTGYTYNQLQIVNKNEKNPPAESQKKFVIEKILSKKLIKNKIHYQVKWTGFKQNTWEPKTQLVKDVPVMVREFERENK